MIGVEDGDQEERMKRIKKAYYEVFGVESQEKVGGSSDVRFQWLIKIINKYEKFRKSVEVSLQK